MADKQVQTTFELSKLLNDIKEKASSNIIAAKNSEEIEFERVNYLGRKSELTFLLKQLKNLDLEAKKLIGAQANQLRQDINILLLKQEKKLQASELSQKLTTEEIDITLPGIKKLRGHLHPVTQMQRRAEDIFQSMGFQIVYPYELDDDAHIFSLINFPLGHPARDNWDTFSTIDGFMPIPHTSAMQNRVISTITPPVKVIIPGRCFRNEATDARHEHTFFQIEGVYVDKGIRLTDMLGTLKTFFTEFYERNIEVKFTPDFFPFVEPGGMMSLTCVLCHGKGCKVCKGSGWLEILGCGMIHPEVLKAANIDPDVFSGFAWGFGLERLMMMKYNIEDVRHFYNGNLKFLRQF
ncbi:MAG: phenylalanine--tRNA ligase subunit alpha [bacterium]